MCVEGAWNYSSIQPDHRRVVWPGFPHLTGLCSRELSWPEIHHSLVLLTALLRSFRAHSMLLRPIDRSLHDQNHNRTTGVGAEELGAYVASRPTSLTEPSTRSAMAYDSDSYSGLKVVANGRDGMRFSDVVPSYDENTMHKVCNAYLWPSFRCIKLI